MRCVASVLLLLAVLTGAGIARADGLPPPPPKGFKSVAIDHEVLLSNDVTGYVYVEIMAGFRNGATSHKLDLNDSKAITIRKPDRRTAMSLYAVPEKVAKEYKTDEDLGNALHNRKIEGVQPFRMASTTTISDTDKRTSVKWTHKIIGVEKDGKLKVETKGDGVDAKPSPTSADDDDTVAKPNLLIAGLALTLALCFGGVWFVLRR